MNFTIFISYKLLNKQKIITQGYNFRIKTVRLRDFKISLSTKSELYMFDEFTLSIQKQLLLKKKYSYLKSNFRI